MHGHVCRTRLMVSQPLFKNCSICAAKITLTDIHSKCLLWLGEAHNIPFCWRCLAFIPQDKKNWEARHRFFLGQKAVFASNSLHGHLKLVPISKKSPLSLQIVVASTSHPTLVVAMVPSLELAMSLQNQLALSAIYSRPNMQKLSDACMEMKHKKKTRHKEKRQKKSSFPDSCPWRVLFLSCLCAQKRQQSETYSGLVRHRLLHIH